MKRFLGLLKKRDLVFTYHVIKKLISLMPSPILRNKRSVSFSKQCLCFAGSCVFQNLNQILLKFTVTKMNHSKYYSPATIISIKQSVSKDFFIKERPVLTQVVI